VDATAAPKVTIEGLARGGTAVYDAAGETALDPAGNVFALPGPGPLHEWLRENGMSFVGVG
jgi:hypothetical protein